LPPPLARGHRHVDDVAGRPLGEAEDRRDGGNGHDREDERGDDRPAYLEHRVAVHLLRSALGAGLLTEPKRDVDGAAEHAEADEDGDPEEGSRQVEDLARVRAGRSQRVLLVVRSRPSAAAGERDNTNQEGGNLACAPKPVRAVQHLPLSALGSAGDRPDSTAVDSPKLNSGTPVGKACDTRKITSRRDPRVTPGATAEPTGGEA